MNTFSNTADRILDVAQDLIQRRGFNAISFNDIALDVGIKKPSIMHHFSSKAELGKAVIRRYRENFEAHLNEISASTDKSAMDALDYYMVPIVDIGKAGDKVCLCGALGGEFMALPESMQKEVSDFFELHIDWLNGILKLGLKSGEFSFSVGSRDMAKLIFDSLQGALIVTRATGNSRHIHDVIKTLRKQISSSSTK